MTANVIELRNVRPQSNQQARQLPGPQLKYQIRWADENGQPQIKSSTDRDVITRQLESCRQRRRPALVKRFEDESDVQGKPCGGVHAITNSRGRLVYQAHFEETSWE